MLLFPYVTYAPVLCVEKLVACTGTSCHMWDRSIVVYFRDFGRVLSSIFSPL